MGDYGGLLSTGVTQLLQPNTPSAKGLLGKDMRLLQQFYPQLAAFSEQMYGQQADFSLEEMRQYAPQLADLQMQLQQKYGLPMAQEQQKEQEALDPQYYATRTALGNQIQGQIGQGLSPQQSQYFGQQMAAQQGAKGMYQSPLSSVNTAKGLTALDMQQRQQNIANASNFLGSYNQSGTANVGIPGGNQMPSVQSSMPNVQQQYGDISSLVNNLAGMQYSQSMGNANQWGAAADPYSRGGGGSSNPYPGASYVYQNGQMSALPSNSGAGGGGSSY